MSPIERPWIEQCKQVYQQFCIVAEKNLLRPTNRVFCEFVGISAGKFQKWRCGQWPVAEDIESLHNKLGFSYRWLVTGEGDPFEEAPQRKRDELMEAMKEEVMANRAHIDAQNDELSDMRERAAELQTKMHALEAALAAAQQRILDLERETAAGNKALLDAQKQLIETMTELRKYERAERLLEGAHGECPAMPFGDTSARGAAQADGEN